MSDDKIKIKDLAVELNVSAKDLMQALRGLEISAKSSQSKRRKARKRQSPSFPILWHFLRCLPVCRRERRGIRG